MPRIEHINEPEQVPGKGPLVAGKFSFTEEELQEIENKGGPEARKAALERAEKITAVQRDTREKSSPPPPRYEIPTQESENAGKIVSLREKIEEALKRHKETNELEDMYKKEAPEK
ncbi:hypothetical protein A2W67_00095 [Candidatus Nomurabacteria bacterium RIFCSPLOWO2_02_40_28]|uniref:Uncharacterized protein n=2 Tax=Candidatus Nomuraibacteriota TaxID=1752729 RepID=A0A837HT47_9BACT|nr:MAG: hypothetical protein UT27_C0009G0001 [Candidatus Nomurabacteria bacterium GW2011_GWD2_39_12]KKR20207.1 MAG: hypothetical protein UT51_C0006G0001 [Candidatus Nomurabacteria bacterium GW2011_GWC2_39_41]KKR36663.1 MAG: hypothetical protein UT70_C0007G0001 [Candidatus Nomurabacteria bacterium GW2011_GWE2_40_10]KKR38104.1 MAG: hypothetical protein UT73_C0006G0001 [Candidatus Nomurabacteria bacterium GW2011_GWB1_40_11]KKR39708.1 MAG: hypothetical protein UT74_C0006G0001 [Parcubacteria group b